jgi:hypothetical protein
MNRTYRGTKRDYIFSITNSNYTKGIINAIKSALPDTVPYKQQLIWTVQRFDFKKSKHNQIILIVQEYGATLTFRTQDDGIMYELTIPELAIEAPLRKKWLGIF